ncbi:MAG: precorrin-6Y C5,15-methyltransferase (decarboxylating) subunit CbiT, partial [Mycobacteriales bacterium]
MVVAERLGEPDETVTSCPPEEAATRPWGEPSVVVCLDPARELSDRGWCWPRPAAAPGWALAEEEFEHRAGLVTKAEVRALTLARLGPGLGLHVWDVGAGSGSVAVECARLGAAVTAVDRDPEAVELTRRNAARHGVDVLTVTGAAPGALAGLADPDAVHVGGGGGELAGILAAVTAASPARVVVPLAAVERVEPVRAALVTAGYAVDAVLLSAARLTPLAGASRLAPVNPTFLVWGVRG